MRQAGVIAACGIVALEENIDRLSIDHYHATIYVDLLKTIHRVEVCL